MAITTTTTTSPGADRPATTSHHPPLPTPPFIPIPGLANLRDAGGYALPSSRQAVRRGILFRSADLTQLEAEGAVALAALGVTKVFDLRSEVEVAKVGSVMEVEGVERVFVPVFREVDYSPEALAERFGDYSDGPEGFVRAYAAILASAADPAHPYSPFRTVLEHLAKSAEGGKAPEPLLIHCTAGKDRTGVLIALILSLCGLSDEAIANDYALTDLGLAPRKEEIVQHLIQGAALFGDRRRAERMVGANKQNMLLTLAHLRTHYGSASLYMTKHLGLSPATVSLIRERLVIDLLEGEEAPVDWREKQGCFTQQRPRSVASR
ncbi:protein-tyrosine phosphatase-like protein [Staphylotrichum tortipilum]|uniref:Protein-tyrosine phosphatase-like protein n=1 Tax=Staphylotrichum tortipilum TaxID=2831512 RepID=A0AAN6RP45_9PEZI|nr:protein-tyrosine phosphatase-like protein [Staphylotrichum longicolle]